MVENTTYITKAESAGSRKNARGGNFAGHTFFAAVLPCAVLVTLNAVISVIISGMNGFGDVYGGAVTFTSWAFQIIFTGKGYTGYLRILYCRRCFRVYSAQ